MDCTLLEKIFVRLDKENTEYNYTLHNVTDISAQEGIRHEVELLEDKLTELEVVLFPLFIARPEFFPCTAGSVWVMGKGDHILEIPFGHFDFRCMVRAFLNYIDRISVRLKHGAPVIVKSITAGIMGDFGAFAKQNSKSGNSEEWVEYSVLLSNQSKEKKLVNIRQCKYGKECLVTEYQPYIILEAGEEKEYIIKVQVTKDIPAGGLEKSTFLFVPDGDGTKAKQIVFSTAKKREHPYLMLTGEQWRRRKQEILSDQRLYQAFFEKYEKGAGEWEVPEVSEKEDFVYPSYSQNALVQSAVAFQITEKEEYKNKAIKFFIGLIDSENGYLATKKSYFEFIEKKSEYARGDFKVQRAQNAGWVQEAEFFNKIAVSYDLLYPFFTLEEHHKIEACLRNYMEFASWRLTDGDGNNFQIAESAAGLLCAMVLQDYGMAERFLYGYNGIFDLLSAVFLDDGMYFEEASGYVKLAGELFFDFANAAENFGISVKDIKIPASFDRNILHAPWAVRESWAEDKKPFLGMSFQRFETFTKPTRCLKDYFDCTAKLLTKEGILFSINDSNEQDFTELYQKAYYLYGEEAYKQIAGQAVLPEPLFVREEQAEDNKRNDFIKHSLLLPGAGFGILRKDNSQAVLKFGTHGGYHGHFDRLSLASFFQENRTFHNNEYAWYGYGSFLFKMWVQTSMAHNMVVVDKRMQKPSPCQCVYYAADQNVSKDTQSRTKDTFSAVCAQTVTEWMDPPYGGQTPYPFLFPEEKCEKEGRYILKPEKTRKQGEIGEYSEPVFSRRMLVLFHGYCIVWDFLAGKKEHCYDCLYHPMGRFDNEDKIIFSKKARFSDDPFGAGQFITNCYTAEIEKTACLRFHSAPARVNPNDIMDFTPESAVFLAWPKSCDITIGRYPQRKDQFTEKELETTAGYLQEPLKKTVSFAAEGKKAEFITILEAGERTGKIKNIECESFDSLIITEEDGAKWRIFAEGINSLHCDFNKELSAKDSIKDIEMHRDKISVKIYKLKEFD